MSGSRGKPLAPYAALVGVFTAGFGGALGAAVASGRAPRRISVVDLGLLGIASHKLSRLVAKDEVTSWARAPFVEERPTDGDEEEEPAGTGLRHAVGELVSCPHCVGQWASASFVAGLVWAPRLTRLVAAVFVVDAVSDFLHVAYVQAKAGN